MKVCTKPRAKIEELPSTCWRRSAQRRRWRTFLLASRPLYQAGNFIGDSRVNKVYGQASAQGVRLAQAIQAKKLRPDVPSGCHIAVSMSVNGGQRFSDPIAGSPLQLRPEPTRGTQLRCRSARRMNPIGR